MDCDSCSGSRPGFLQQLAALGLALLPVALVDGLAQGSEHRYPFPATDSVTIDRKKMQLAEPLKALGSFEIPVRLMTDVVATLKVEVVKKS